MPSRTLKIVLKAACNPEKLFHKTHMTDIVIVYLHFPASNERVHLITDKESWNRNSEATFVKNL
jgi:hypothetical protein